jgi:hypothetical protein
MARAVDGEDAGEGAEAGILFTPLNLKTGLTDSFVVGRKYRRPHGLFIRHLDG